jgi:ABC-type Fe3+-hydroxamate transport system substrate-binding protein
MRSDPVWKSLPDCKEQQEYYSQAASYFRTVKDAWRNHTMHARAKYTEEEAEQIFNAIKGFMQKLAERLAE